MQQAIFWTTNTIPKIIYSEKNLKLHHPQLSQAMFKTFLYDNFRPKRGQNKVQKQLRSNLQLTNVS